MNPSQLAGLVRALSDIEPFSQAVLRRPLRPYQLDVARAILRSIDEQAGRTITVMMPRQSGKNETSAQLEAFLVALARTEPPVQRSRRTMQLLCDRIVELQIVPDITDEVIRRLLIRTSSGPGRRRGG